MRHARFALFGGVLALVPGVPGPGDDEEVPKRLPALSWEREVACDTAAEIVADAASAPRRCHIVVTGGAVYLHEHTVADAPGGRFRLSRFDIATGDERWARDVGPSSTLDAYDEIVVISDKSHFEVYDAETGDLRFEREGSVTEVNRYGTLLLTDGSTVTALDPTTGEVRWRADGALGAVCRDIVVVIPPVEDTVAQPFIVVDHLSGEERWTSDTPFDPREGDVTCGFGPFVYTSEGDTVREWDALSGWINWTATVPHAHDIEVYREVALVRSGAGAGTVVAVERETGEVRWERPAAEVGTSVSIVGRVREDAEGVFTLHPLTGDIINHTVLTHGAPFEVVASSDTRVVVASGSVVTAYGMNDLGTAWQLDVGGAPDEFGVAAGHLVVRTGSLLRGYR
jgi:outer membrane protein assembly factor BamB